MSHTLSPEEIKSMSYKEFDAKLRRIHDKRKMKPTKTWPFYEISKKIRKFNPEVFRGYEFDDMYPVLTRTLELLRDRIIYDGYLLTFPYSMGVLFIADVRKDFDKVFVPYRVVDWSRTMKEWHETGEVHKVYSDMALSRYVSSYRYGRHYPQILKDYYVFKIMRPFRQEMKKAYLNNQIICYE